jgi:hypothetical protein
VAAFVAAAAPAALACDYPGGPPGSEPVTSDGPGIVWAYYSNATARYAHGVLGDAIEAGTLRMEVRVPGGPYLGACEAYVHHEDGTVFEDIAPRIADMDGDGLTDTVVVESKPGAGAALVVYGMKDGALARIGATPQIGRSHRWLAPAGIADLDGDGQNDVAYVETPHIGGTLRVWTMRDGALVQIAEAPGFSNHRIGEDWITGGVRDCGNGPELVLPNFDWTRLMAVELRNGALATREIGDKATRGAVELALACQD